MEYKSEFFESQLEEHFWDMFGGSDEHGNAKETAAECKQIAILFHQWMERTEMVRGMHRECGVIEFDFDTFIKEEYGK